MNFREIPNVPVSVDEAIVKAHEVLRGMNCPDLVEVCTDATKAAALGTEELPKVLGGLVGNDIELANEITKCGRGVITVARQVVKLTGQVTALAVIVGGVVGVGYIMWKKQKNLEQRIQRMESRL